MAVLMQFILLGYDTLAGNITPETTNTLIAKIHSS